MARRSSAAARNRDESREVIRLPDGSAASVEGAAIALRDADGRLCVRFANGMAEISAPDGDLVLSAPSGRVVVRSAMDVEIDAARDVVHKASRRISLAAGGEGAPAQIEIEPERAHVSIKKLEIEAARSRVVTGQATIIAQQITTTAQRVAQSVERWELSATRIVETAKDAFRDVTDLFQSRIGRARTRVLGAYALHARRATIASQEETKVDGKKVLLG